MRAMPVPRFFEVRARSAAARPVRTRTHQLEGRHETGATVQGRGIGFMNRSASAGAVAGGPTRQGYAGDDRSTIDSEKTNGGRPRPPAADTPLIRNSRSAK